jgi:hypothetical protein
MLNKEEKDSWAWFLVIYAIICALAVVLSMGCAGTPKEDTWLDDPSYDCCHIDTPKPDGPIDYILYGLADFGKMVSLLSIF